jgi:hypothetical protein
VRGSLKAAGELALGLPPTDAAARDDVRDPTRSKAVIGTGTIRANSTAEPR